MFEMKGMKMNFRKFLEWIVFEVRWILYPVNMGLMIALFAYVGAFLYTDFLFIRDHYRPNMEYLMVVLLGLVDASMVANLIVMIIQGSHQIFIHKLETREHGNMPQYLDHIDTGILKVKVAMSIAGITLIHVLKDFFNLERVDWTLACHRMAIHGMALISALMMALIWRVTHPDPMRAKEASHEK
jgi:uncharacterized protein (TIGR00645 family)